MRIYFVTTMLAASIFGNAEPPALIRPTSIPSQTQSSAEVSTKPARHPILEVATIKPVKEFNAYNTRDVKQGRHLFVYQATVKYLMMLAYDVDLSQVVSGPGWSGDDLFDVQAQAIAGVDPREGDNAEELLKELLTDRFKLIFHREQRMLSVYDLSVAKGGSKLKASDPSGSSNGGGCTHFGECSFSNDSLSRFSSWLSFTVLDRKVIDRTGLTGNFEFDLKWTPDESQFARYGATVPREGSKGPNLFTAIQEQLGLQLKRAKAPLDVLVIDHVEKPSEN
jgi:uncharacterized protein (TIGR03435 family)